MLAKCYLSTDIVYLLYLDWTGERHPGYHRQCCFVQGSWPSCGGAIPSHDLTPCTAHCLDLLLEDIGKLAWAKDLLREGKDIVQFIMNHHKSLAIFREHSTMELL
jgi:hypothetical protein